MINGNIFHNSVDPIDFQKITARTFIENAQTVLKNIQITIVSQEPFQFLSLVRKNQTPLKIPLCKQKMEMPNGRIKKDVF